MRSRRTARVLLFDALGRVLLVQARDGLVEDPLGGRPPGSTFWFTPGGGLAEGETLRAAARRELMEETGLANAEIGPAVWYGEQTLRVRGELVRFQETFVLARTPEVTLSRGGWEAHERDSLLDVRWWTSEALRTTDELILPSLLVARVEALSALARGTLHEDGLTVERVDLR